MVYPMRLQPQRDPTRLLFPALLAIPPTLAVPHGTVPTVLAGTAVLAGIAGLGIRRARGTAADIAAALEAAELAELPLHLPAGAR